MVKIEGKYREIMDKTEWVAIVTSAALNILSLKTISFFVSLCYILLS